MADRGMGIRLFNTREGLLQIFESFENEHLDEEEFDDDEIAGDATAVITSQLRHFVIQVLMNNVLLKMKSDIWRNTYQILCCWTQRKPWTTKTWLAGKSVDGRSS